MSELKPVAWEMKKNDESYHSITPNEDSTLLKKSRVDQDWVVTPLYSIPEGYVLVPEEPTQNMVKAGCDAIRKNGGEGSDEELSGDAVCAYKVMINELGEGLHEQ